MNILLLQSIFFLSYGSAQSAARSYCIHLETMRGFRLKEGEHSEQGKKGEHRMAAPGGWNSILTWSLQHGSISLNSFGSIMFPVAERILTARPAWWTKLVPSVGT